MSLIKWTPRRSFLSPYSVGTLGSEFDRFFDSLFHDNLDRTSITVENWVPVFDVIENEKEFVVKVETPGMNKSDIQISVKDGVMTVSGEKKIDKSDKSRHYLRQESHYGRFSRSLYLTDEIDEKKIKANYKNGLLTVTVPKMKNGVSKQFNVEIN